MAPNLLKKSCDLCGKNFFTYDVEMKFCNTKCEIRKKYNDHFKTKFKGHTRRSTCKHCHDELFQKGAGATKNFCNHVCASRFTKNQEEMLRSQEPKKVKPQRAVPYHILNEIEEKKRVFQDDSWLYRNNPNRI